MIFLLLCGLIVSPTLLLASAVDDSSSVPSTKIVWDTPWTYGCVLETIDGPACQRQLFNKTSEESERIPLNVCLLTCGDYGALWPYPSQKLSLGKELTAFLFEGINLFKIEAPSSEIETRLKEATDIILKHVRQSIPVPNPDEKQVFVENKNTVEIHLRVESSVEKITLDVDESYALSINTTIATGGNAVVRITLLGKTYFGVRHGLETVAQLIAFNEEKSLLQIVNQVEIEDKPTFSYRGILVDTGRNFIPVPNLKRVIDGLSHNKLNALHWHLSDSNSFPFQSARVPQVTRFGIFSSSKVYTPQDVTDLIEYANVRGVKIIPELDAPSHAGNGWQWGPSEGLGELSLCINAQPYKTYCIQPPCGQLNPLNNNTYFVIGELYKDLLDVFDRDIFHMGGDELSYRCWLAYEHIQEWLATHSPDLMDLWGLFQEQALEKLKEANNKQPISAIVWTSEMTNNGRRFLNPTDYIIQIWSTSNDPVIKDVLNENYRVIFSNNDTMYLDHGYGAWRGTENKATLKNWQTFYGHDILGMVESKLGKDRAVKMLKSGQIMGGEATLWSEKVDAQNIETRLWPRGAALAERLWSNPGKSRTRFAYPRLIHQRERMVQRGIQADTLLPEACYNIWGFCDDPEPTLMKMQ